MAPTTDRRIVGGWIADAAVRLRAAGATSPRPEAEAICAHVLGLRWSDLWTRTASAFPSSAEADALVRRRAAGEPLAYVLGSTGFFGLDIDCGPGVLVPRPETETLVEVALELIGAAPVVVDVGTGSGAVACAMARAVPGAEVWATDRSAEALDWARRNVTRLAPQVRVRGGDLFAALPVDRRGVVDLVVSNPPYLSEAEARRLPADVGREPAEALVAGTTGDEVLEALVDASSDWLRPSGSIALEVGTPAQAERLFARLADWRERGVREDLSGRPRVVWAAGPP